MHFAQMRGQRGKSRADGAYDWEADATRGVQVRGPWPHEYRHLKMVWELKARVWRGSWRWTPWAEEVEPLNRLEDRERIGRGWDTGSIPQETLLQMIQSVVYSYLWASARRLHKGNVTTLARWPRPVNGLADLALVCRAWYTLISPALYHTLKLSRPVASNSLRQSTMRNVRRISIHDAPSRSSHLSLPRHYPCLRSNVVWLSYTGPKEKNRSIATVYHPSHASIYTQLHRSFSNVARLELDHYHFHSSLDLLHLLTSFPVLVRADLWNITVAHVSQAMFVRPGRRGSQTSRLRDILVYSPGHVPFVAQCLTGPHVPPQRHVPQFRGLSRSERLLVLRLGEQVMSGSTQYHINAMDPNGEMCTCSKLSPRVPRADDWWSH